jgi:Sel1 repeat
MKMIFFCCFYALAVSVMAQTARESIGAYGGGYSPAEANWTPQLQKQLDDQTALRELNGHIYRRIDGKIYNLFTDGKSVAGEVEANDNGILILNKPYSQNTERIAIKNYSGENATEGRAITVRAMHIGTYNWGDIPCEFWDCGTLLSPQEEQQKINEINEARETQQKILEDVARQKNFITQSNAIISLLPHGTNGEAWAQTSLAIHYLKGQGCDTNQTLAVYWFEKAAAQGDSEASNYLARINLVSTNAVVVGNKAN